jgi:hypothetical protein
VVVTFQPNQMTQPVDHNQDLYDHLVALVATHTGRKKDTIQLNSRLFHDLGVDGADADNLLAAVRDTFAIDFSRFDFDRHFGPELPFNPFSWLWCFLFDREQLNAAGTAWKKVPITVADLYAAATTRSFPDLSDRPAE